VEVAKAVAAIRGGDVRLEWLGESTSRKSQIDRNLQLIADASLKLKGSFLKLVLPRISGGGQSLHDDVSAELQAAVRESCRLARVAPDAEHPPGE
jgi:hypothetical protein